MRACFDTIADHIQGSIRGGEGFTLWLSGEDSDFARLNQGRVRQPGSVSQCSASLRLIQGRRHATVQVAISGEQSGDLARIDHALDRLRAVLPHLPDDPHLLINETVSSSDDDRSGARPDARQMVDALLEEGDGLDLVGIVASGSVFRGFANHLGQRNWFARSSFNLDWCLVHDADKAVKCSLADFSFDRAAVTARMADARRQLEVLRRPSRTIEPGRYRAWLTPSAVSEVLGVLNWGGFSLKGLKTGHSPLRRFWNGDDQLDDRVDLIEDVAGGIAPDFQADGFRRPAQVQIFEGGRMVGALASPRSAREYGVPTTGAGSNELPESLSLAAGDIATGTELSRLENGLYIGNLWYTNFSDRAACRITGMTRFATFWVQGGEIVCPVDVMRFDETLGQLLGSGLEGLSEAAEFQPSNMTYFERSTQSVRCPGALVSEMRFTL